MGMKKVIVSLIVILALVNLVIAVTVIKGKITEQDLNDVEFGVIRGSVLSQITDDDETVVFEWPNGIYSVFAVPEGEEIPYDELLRVVCNKENETEAKRTGEFSIKDNEGTRLVFSEIWEYNSIEFYRTISEPSTYICPWECYTKYDQIYEGETGGYMILAKQGDYNLITMDTRISELCDSI